jgi:LysM repeat protein
MNNPNPFLPQGSLLEQKSKKRTRVKIAVFTIFAINIAVLSPLLIQGCRKEPTLSQTDTGATTSPAGTNLSTAESPSNQPPPLTAPDTNPPPVVSAPPTNPAPAVTAPPPTSPAPGTGTPSEYVVAKGDSFYTLGKKFGVSIKDLKAANPGVVPTKLKVGQKLQIPSGGLAGNGGSVVGAPGTAPSGEVSETIYVVKSRDTLTKIAHDHGVSLKALRAANDLKTDSIKVGQKLKLPAKPAVAAAPAGTETVNTPTTNPAPGTAR